MSPDPWTSFLDWLTTVLVPDWGELILLLPYVVFGTIVGPILTIIGLMWVWYLVTRRRGRVKHVELQPVPAPRDDTGAVSVPPSVPYCEEHGLIYPARARQCEIDRADLSVVCPVDGTVRDADIDTCAACGTKYVLGANASAVVVAAQDGPPEGGAAIA